MTMNQFFDQVCLYAGTTLAAKAKSKTTQFVLGALAGGAGRKVLEEKFSPMAPYFTKDGEVDITAVKTSVEAGFKASGSLPVLGGMVSIDATDAAEFFEKISSQVVANPI